MNPPPNIPPRIATLAKPAAITALPPIKLDPTGRIDDDVSCRKCGYNLRGLLPDGRCPECGTAVGRSLHGDLLRFSDPDWVQKLASGMNWIFASIIIGLIGGVLGAIFLGVFSSILSSRSFIVLAPSSGLVFGLVALVGYWKVTTPDPARLSGESNLSSRKLVRIAQLTNYVVTPVNSLMQHLAWFVPVMIMSVVSGIIGLVGTVAIFLYGRKLALRIPDEKLARHCKIVMWGLAFMVAISMSFAIYVASAAPMFTPPTTTTSAPAGPTTTGSGNSYIVTYNSTTGTTTGGTGTTTTTTVPTPSPLRVAAMAGSGCVMLVGGLIFGIWSLRILLKFRKHLNDSAEIARRTWAAQSTVAPPMPGPPPASTLLP